MKAYRINAIVHEDRPTTDMQHCFDWLQDNASHYWEAISEGGAGIIETAVVDLEKLIIAIEAGEVENGVSGDKPTRSESIADIRDDIAYANARRDEYVQYYLL